MGIAVAAEREDRAAPAVRTHGRGEPDLAGAALHLVPLGAVALGQRREAATELDDVTIAVVPFVEQRKIVDNLVEGRRVGRGRGHGFGHSQYIGAGIAPVAEKGPVPT